VVVSIVVAVLVLVGFALAVVSPLFNAQSAKAADTNAKADVSTLGRDIAMYYVDNVGPVPEITIIDGRYHLNTGTSRSGYNDEPVSPGVQLGGVNGTGPMDWCVWVTNPKGVYQDFQYSAQRGLEIGSC
jgi:type II secretory pathway pseudopilin PulG